jgi:hypothetical protein
MQNHPKPNLKLILQPKEDFRDIFQPGWPGPCNQLLKVNKKFAEIPWAWLKFNKNLEIPQGRLKISLKYVEIPGEGRGGGQKMDVLNRGGGVRSNNAISQLGCCFAHFRLALRQ